MRTIFRVKANVCGDGSVWLSGKPRGDRRTQKLQRLLELQDDDIALVEHDIITQIKAAQEDYQAKLHRYQQEVARTVKLEFPVQPPTYSGL